MVGWDDTEALGLTDGGHKLSCILRLFLQTFPAQVPEGPTRSQPEKVGVADGARLMIGWDDTEVVGLCVG